MCLKRIARFFAVCYKCSWKYCQYSQRESAVRGFKVYGDNDDFSFFYRFWLQNLYQNILKIIKKNIQKSSTNLYQNRAKIIQQSIKNHPTGGWGPLGFVLANFFGFWVRIRHEVGLRRCLHRIFPTSLQEPFKPTRTLKTVLKTQLLEPNIFRKHDRVY